MNARARQSSLRLEVAREAARLVAQSGRRDFHAAKHKAAARLGVRGKGALPSNQEIQEALLEHQRLFHGQVHRDHVEEMLDHAQRAMTLLEVFEPRLVGALANGSADENSPVTLHLFSDPPEAVPAHLREQGIRFRSSERRVKYSESRHDRVPIYELLLSRLEIALWVFPQDGLRQAPLDAVDGRPTRRLRTAKLEELRAHYRHASAPW